MSESVYKSNIAVLESKHPDVCKVLNAGGTEDNGLSIIVEEGDSKSLPLILFNEKKYQLESRYDNNLFIQLMKVQIGEDWDLNARLLMFGLGSGMYVREFLKTYSDDHRITVFEPSSYLFNELLKLYDYTDIFNNDRFTLILKGSDYSQLTANLNSTIEYTDLFSIRVLKYPNYDSIFSDEAIKWRKEIDSTANKVSGDYYLYERWADLFFVNNFNNFKYFAKSKSLHCLKNTIPKGIPVIIVGAGPSLAKNINELKRAKGHALIMGIDAAVNPLCKAGIEPDVIIAVDAIKGEKYLAELHNDSIPLVCQLNVEHTLISAHKGDKFFNIGNNVYSNEYLKDLDKNLVHLNTAGSVACDAFSLAMYMGAQTFILVGQDLAYTGKKTHVEGSVRGNEDQAFIDKEIGNLMMIEDIDGNPVQTCVEFMQYLKWFEDNIREYPDKRFIDATEGGARIEGTELITLKQAIDETCTEDFDFGRIFGNAEYLLNLEEQRDYINHILGLRDKIISNKSRIKECLMVYAEMRNLASKGQVNSSKMRTLSTRSNTILNRIQSDPAMEYVLDHVKAQTNEILSTVYKTEKNPTAEVLAICATGEKYLNVLEGSIEDILKSMEEYTDELLKVKAAYEEDLWDA